MTGVEAVVKRPSLRKRSAGEDIQVQRRLSWKGDKENTSREVVFGGRPPSIDQSRIQPLDRITDQRSAPSKVDHFHIANSFQQGLDNVEQVIIYDPDHPDSDTEDDGKVTVLSWRQALIKQFYSFCRAIFHCHSCLRF
ncbi:unnamed protein product [Effrenium voratum]|nr:unnamed protein product [Effrenium voratum]